MDTDNKSRKGDKLSASRSTKQRLKTDDPIEWLTIVMQADDIDMTHRMAAAKALAGIHKARGKKAQQQDDAMAADKGTGWEGLMR